MTEFFFAGLESDGKLAEAAYMHLRERSHVAIGSDAKPRRIFSLDCRFEGSDCEIEVGKPLPHGGDVVVAILDHGREEPFVVFTNDEQGPLTRVTRPVYAVTEFS
jgi:hypothetical protein